MHINDWIETLEKRNDITVEDFYAHLVRAIEILKERLEFASEDGIDIKKVERKVQSGL